MWLLRRLHKTHTSMNECAESTLSFLLALAEMRALHNATASFDAQPASP